MTSGNRSTGRTVAMAAFILWLVGGCASPQPSAAPAPPATKTVASPAQPGSSTSGAPSTVAGPSVTPTAGDAATAGSLVDSYERALVNGQWQAAWDMLSPADQGRRGTLADYTSERSAYFQSVAGRYTLSTPNNAATALSPWTSSPDLVQGADLPRAYIVEADYPALAGNNAGYEVLLVAPDATGGWRIWEVR